MGKSGKWVVFTHPTKGDGCPSCKGAKEYMKQKKMAFSSRRGNEDGTPHPEHKTWPKIEDPNGRFVGGYSDLKQLNF